MAGFELQIVTTSHKSVSPYSLLAIMSSTLIYVVEINNAEITQTTFSKATGSLKKLRRLHSTIFSKAESLIYITLLWSKQLAVCTRFSDFIAQIHYKILIYECKTEASFCLLKPLEKFAFNNKFLADRWNIYLQNNCQFPSGQHIPSLIIKSLSWIKRTALNWIRGKKHSQSLVAWQDNQLPCSHPSTQIFLLALSL